jgi:tuftelin-interacting protein 11
VYALTSDNALVFSFLFCSHLFCSASSGAPTGKAGEISFKDVVEAYAAESGVTFMPRPGRVHEGKQIWVFGKSNCYLDQDVVFASAGDGTWRPMGLEDLLKIS